MNKLNTTIIALVVAILLLATIFVLKVKGVMRSDSKVRQEITIQNNIEDTLNNNTENTLNNDEDTYNKTAQDALSMVESSKLKLFRGFFTLRTVVTLGIILAVILFGYYKMYRKLGIDGILTKTYIILSFGVILMIIAVPKNYTNSARYVIIGLLIELIYLISWTYVNCNLYDKLKMDPKIAFAPITIRVLNFIPIIGPICAFPIAIMLLYYYIVKALRLSSTFDKGKLFAIGIIFLPLLFIPILGYSNDSYTKKHAE